MHFIQGNDSCKYPPSAPAPLPGPLAGHMVARAELQAAPMSSVGAVCLEAAGPGRLLVADSRGCLHLFAAMLHSGMLQRLQLLAHFPPPGSRYHEPACLEYAPHSALARGPAVLLVLSSGEVILSRLHEKVGGSGTLSLSCSLIAQRMVCCAPLCWPCLPHRMPLYHEIQAGCQLATAIMLAPTVNAHRP